MVTKTTKKPTAAPRPKITAWSYSRWDGHSGEAGCPYKTYLQVVEKRRSPPNEAMDRGRTIHELAESTLRHPQLELPVELKQVAKEFPRLRKLAAAKPEPKAKPELELCFNADWQPVRWMAPDAWCRIKIDVIAATHPKWKTIEVIDWKTGKYKPENKGYKLQSELYATGSMHAYDFVDEVKTRLIFVDHDQRIAPPYEMTFKRSQLGDLTKAWLTRIKPLLSDTIYAPRPGWYCGWCSFSKKNAGPCVY